MKKRQRRSLREWKRDYDMNKYYAETYGGGMRFYFLYYIGWEIQHFCKTLVCRFKDHDWRDDSYGGPDSGCIDMTCKRCGYNVHTPLY